MILGASRYIPIRNVSPRNGFPLEDISPYRPAWPAVHKLPSSKSIHHWDKKDAGDSFVPVRVTQVCWYMRSRPNKVAVHQVCSHGKENDISSKSFSDAITGQENKNAACVCLSLSLFLSSASDDDKKGVRHRLFLRLAFPSGASSNVAKHLILFFL